VGVFAWGAASALAKDMLAVLPITCRLLYTQSSSGKIYKCIGGRVLPAGGIFLSVVPQGDSFQEAH